jgi:alkylation response protein AidB-like acyl-CoA dehydrogenase
MGYSNDTGIEQMNLTYSEEQNLLRESVERFVGNTYANRGKAPAAEKTDGFDPAVWKQFADLGWLSLQLPETADKRTFHMPQQIRNTKLPQSAGEIDGQSLMPLLGVGAAFLMPSGKANAQQVLHQKPPPTCQVPLRAPR